MTNFMNNIQEAMLEFTKNTLGKSEFSLYVLYNKDNWSKELSPSITGSKDEAMKLNFNLNTTFVIEDNKYLITIGSGVDEYIYTLNKEDIYKITFEIDGFELDFLTNQGYTKDVLETIKEDVFSWNEFGKVIQETYLIDDKTVNTSIDSLLTLNKS